VRITLNDSRQLAVCVIMPAADKFYNWSTTGWEQPFLAKSHLLPLTPMEGIGSPFSTIVGADLGMVMVERTDVVAVVMTVDGTGAPIAVVDVWQAPYPVQYPTRGGWTH